VKTRSYAVVTGGYWAFTVTDGALRMLVLLYFHDLGYSPVSIAFLFLAYEFMGILTNLLGGWVGSRTGLNRTLVVGLGLQIAALAALTLHDPGWREWISVTFVMTVQAVSGIAKDLTKMSSKSAVKAVAGNAVMVLLGEDIGRSKRKAPLRSILSKSVAINRLSTARFFLFGARDIWFVVALPVFLDEQLGWATQGIGAFMALWVIGYGMVQSVAPQALRRRGRVVDEVAAARTWALALAAVSAALALAVAFDVAVTASVVGGLIVFGIVFALNSSLHSYLILAYSDDDAVAMDVGFYYSANAAGRLVGTLLSGVLYLWGGLPGALWGSAAFVAITWLLTLRLPALPRRVEAGAVVPLV
jgi:predicted MFS family arabinose efflux permease